MMSPCHKFPASPGKRCVTFEIHSAWAGEGQGAAEPLAGAQAAEGLARSTDGVDCSSRIVLRSVASQRRKLLQRPREV